MNAVVNSPTDSPIESPASRSALPNGNKSGFEALGFMGLAASLGLSILGGFIARDGSRAALLALGASVLGALACAFTGNRLTNFPARRGSWFIVAGALLARGIGEILSGKGGTLSLPGALLLALHPLILGFGLLGLARATSVPHALQPGEQPGDEPPPPYDWALAPDAIVIGGALSAVTWWMLVEPMQVAKATSLSSPGVWHFVAFANLTVAALLVVGRREMHPVVSTEANHTSMIGHARTGILAPGWRAAWLAAWLGTLLWAGAAYRIFWLPSGIPQLLDVVLRVAPPLLIATLALWEGLALSRQMPAPSPAPLDAHAARAFWLRNLAPLFCAGLAVLSWQAHLYARGPHTLAGAPGEAWWGVALIALALLRHALDSLLNTHQTFEDYRSWNSLASGLQADVDARTRELSTLHAVAADLSNTLDSAKILSTALERAMNSLHGDAGAIWLFKEAAPEETPLAVTGTAGQDGYDATKDKPVDRRKSALAGRVAEVNSRASASSIRNAMVEAALAQTLPVSQPEWAAKGEQWFLVQAAGDDPTEGRGELQRNALKALHQGLEQGEMENARLTCQSLGNSFQGACIVPLQWKGEILGAVSILRHRDAITTAENALLQSLALEAGAALQNAHLYQEAVRLADRDSLTDLLNHRAAQQQLHICLSRAARSRDQFVILMMDLNNFKFFNDTYGHHIGDEVLRRVAECLRQSCRISDVIGRYGGDEFIAVLLDTDTEGARVVVNRIEQKVAEQALESADGRRIPIGLSLGAAVFPHDGDKALELLSVADANVNEAKIAGGGFVVRSHAEESEELKALKDASVGGSFGVLDALVTAIDNKDNYTRRHSEDVARWGVMIAKQLGFTPEQQRSLRMCGLLHDVGKIAVPDSILRKPGRLNDDEFKVMQQHPVFGALIVKEVPDLDEVLGGIKHHHERHDGRGYPDRLKGEDIPLFGRILAVPDCFSAMTTNRPYRQGLSWEEAIAEIERGKGTQFDPVMADAFMRGIREMQAEEQAKKDRAAGITDSAPTTEQSESGEINGDLAQPGDPRFGDSGYFMNIKPRSVTDAELESAGQK